MKKNIKHPSPPSTRDSLPGSKQDGMAIKTPATAIDCRGDWFVSWSWEILRSGWGGVHWMHWIPQGLLPTSNNHIKANWCQLFWPALHFFSQCSQSILTASNFETSSFWDDISTMLHRSRVPCPSFHSSFTQCPPRDNCSPAPELSLEKNAKTLELESLEKKRSWVNDRIM